MPPFQYDWSKTPKSYLDKNDKIGLLIGSLLAGGMGAATGYGGGDSALRGVAGAAAGFGGGANQLEETYSKMIKESMQRQQQEYDQNMGNDVFGLNKEKFGFKQKQFEESEKPYREADARWRDSMARNADFDNQMALQKLINESVSKDRNARYDKRERQIDLGIKKNKLLESRPGMAKLSAEQAQFESQWRFAPTDRGTPEYIEAFKTFKSAGSKKSGESDIYDDIDTYRKGESLDKSTNMPTQEDLEFTAKKYGITTDEVLKRMRKQ